MASGASLALTLIKRNGGELVKSQKIERSFDVAETQVSSSCARRAWNFGTPSLRADATNISEAHATLFLVVWRKRTFLTNARTVCYKSTWTVAFARTLPRLAKVFRFGRPAVATPLTAIPPGIGTARHFSGDGNLLPRDGGSHGLDVVALMEKWTSQPPFSKQNE